MDNKSFFANLAGAQEGEQAPHIITASTGSDKDKKNPNIPSRRKKKRRNGGNRNREDIKLDLNNEESSDVMSDFDDVEGQLTIDVHQDDQNIYIESTVAGVEAEDLDISITPESVVIKGRRSRKKKIKREHYLYQECFWGTFSRSVILPQEIDADRAKASIKNGVLKITLPKINRSKSKRIKVRLD